MNDEQSTEQKQRTRTNLSALLFQHGWEQYSQTRAGIMHYTSRSSARGRGGCESVQSPLCSRHASAAGFMDTGHISNHLEASSGYRRDCIPQLHIDSLRTLPAIDPPQTVPSVWLLMCPVPMHPAALACLIVWLFGCLAVGLIVGLFGCLTACCLTV